MNREKLLLAAGCAAFVAAVATAQTPPQQAPAPPHFRNLQILPKDIAGPQLSQIMKGFSQALGVRCINCHAGEPGQPLSTFDFASDAKKEKLVARKMMTMVHRINEQDFGAKEIKVTCFTCHRGAVKPLTTPPVAPTTASHAPTTASHAPAPTVLGRG